MWITRFCCPQTFVYPSFVLFFINISILFCYSPNISPVHNSWIHPSLFYHEIFLEHVFPKMQPTGIIIVIVSMVSFGSVKSLFTLEFYGAFIYWLAAGVHVIVDMDWMFVLSLQLLQRVQSGGSLYKSAAHLSLPSTLYTHPAECIKPPYLHSTGSSLATAEK